MAAPDTVAQHTVRVTLKGYDNDTYTGTLILRNLSAFIGNNLGGVRTPAPVNMSVPIPGSPGHPVDPSGASYYVVAVVLVYGMSIVMLIASHIKRKHTKLVEDRQIHKYLQEFMIVKEKSSRDSYKSLKRSIMAKLNVHHRNPTYKTLSHAILPMIAVGLPRPRDDGFFSSDVELSAAARRASLQPNLNHSSHSLLGSRGRARRASEFDINWRQISALSDRMFRRGSDELTESRRGRRSRTNSHSLPSTVGEGRAHSQNEMSTVLEMSDDESPKPEVLTATTDISEDSVDLPGPVTPESESNNARYYYKPVSISRACRVYEIPRNAKCELMKPGGVHVVLQRPVSPTRQPTGGGHRTDAAQNKSGFLNELLSRPRPQNGVTLFNRSPVGDNEVAHRLDTVVEVESPGAVDICSRQPVPPDGSDTCPGDPRTSAHRPETGTTPALIHPVPSYDHVTRPVTHSSRPKLIDRRLSSTGRINANQTYPTHDPSHRYGDNIRIKPSQDLLIQDQSSPIHKEVKSSGKPLQIDVPVSTRQLLNNEPPRHADRDSPSDAHQGELRRSSWGPSTQRGRVKEAAARKQMSSLSSSSPTPKGTPEARDRSASVSYESVSLYSETSSESDDVWQAMRQRAALQLETPSGDADDLNYRPPFTEMEFRGLGSTPLLTPKEQHFDTGHVKRSVARSLSSRSNSPVYSQGSDSDKLLHQVTSV